MSLRTLASLGPLAGKRVVVRCDLNVPLRDGVITDDGRVRASLPTLNALIDQGARLVICSHLGRPDGAPDPKYSLEPVAQRLSELLGKPVAFARDTVGESAQDAVAALEDGDVAVIENLRFNPGETAKDEGERKAFAGQLAELADALVSDGFGVVHRKQASVYELAEILPSAAGYLIEKEVEVLDRLTETPERPYAVVLGGMMFTFLAAAGYKVGASLLEADQLDTVKRYVETAKERGVELVLPVDAVVAASFSADAEHVVAPASALEDTAFGAAGLGLDIGPETAKQFAEVIRSSKTVFWNGPMGVFEMPAFAEGTKVVAGALTDVDGLSVVGGGDSAAAVRQLGFADDEFGHISTGGGASLEFLEGKKLPGLEVLGWSL